MRFQSRHVQLCPSLPPAISAPGTTTRLLSPRGTRLIPQWARVGHNSVAPDTILVWLSNDARWTQLKPSNGNGAAAASSYQPYRVPIYFQYSPAAQQQVALTLRDSTGPVSARSTKTGGVLGAVTVTPGSSSSTPFRVNADRTQSPARPRFIGPDEKVPPTAASADVFPVWVQMRSPGNSPETFCHFSTAESARVQQAWTQLRSVALVRQHDVHSPSRSGGQGTRAR